MKYLIDTDILIYFLKGHEHVTKRFLDATHTSIHTSIINHAELFYGAYHSQHKKKNISRISGFLETMTVLPFCENSSCVFAELKSKLNSAGSSLADLDLMIASICLNNEMVLVTNNVKHFKRVPKLKLENWSKV